MQDAQVVCLCMYFTPTGNKPKAHSGELPLRTWPVFARSLLLCKFLDEVIDADVFHILLEFLVNLWQRKTEGLLSLLVPKAIYMRKKCHEKY